VIGDEGGVDILLKARYKIPLNKSKKYLVKEV
jgi:hypothetical protein